MNPSTDRSVKERVLDFLQDRREMWGDESYYAISEIADEEDVAASRSSVRRAIRALGDRLDNYQVEPGLEEAGYYSPGRPPMVYAIKEEDENEHSC